MDLRQQLILKDLETMVQACKAIFDRVSQNGRQPIPIELRSRIADEVVSAARHGNYTRDEMIAAVAQQMVKLLPAPTPLPPADWN